MSDDDSVPVRVRIEVHSRFFESSQARVMLTDPADDDPREVAAELLAGLSRQVADSIDAVLPTGDAELLANALANRISPAADADDFTDEDGDLDVKRVVDYFGGRFDLVKRELSRSEDQRQTNREMIKTQQKLIDTVAMKVRAERAVAGEMGWVGVDELDAILAGKAVPVDRIGHPLSQMKKDHAKLVELVTELHGKACSGYVSSPVERVQRVLDVVTRLTDLYGVDILSHLDSLVVMTPAVARAIGLPPACTEQEIYARLAELATEHTVLARCAASLGVRPERVHTQITDLKVFRENIAHALGMSPAASSQLVLAEAMMIKSNMDMLHEVHGRISVLVIEELGIQEEALRPQGLLDADVSEALRHAHSVRAVGLEDLLTALGLPLLATAPQVLDKVRELAAENAQMNAGFRELVDTVAQFNLFDGPTDIHNVADRLAGLFASGSVETLPPQSARIARPVVEGCLNPRVRAVRIRTDIESGRDVLFVRDMAVPGMFTATGPDGSGVRYSWETLAEDSAEDLVDASGEVRYQAVFSPANAGRDQVEIIDTVTGESVNAFHKTSAANAELRRLNGAEKPAALV